MNYIYIDELTVSAIHGTPVYVNGKYLNVQPCYSNDDIPCDLRCVKGRTAYVEYGINDTIELVSLKHVFVMIDGKKYYLKNRSFLNKIKEFVGFLMSGSRR